VSIFHVPFAIQAKVRSSAMANEKYQMENDKWKVFSAFSAFMASRVRNFCGNIGV
jgi:hypothetical protein